jgi:hypothetical protein
MAQRLAACTLALALTSTGAWAATQPHERGGAALLAANERNVADYDLGYRDGYTNQPYRLRDRSNRDYAEGYKVGQSRREATAGAPGSDNYERGFGDGLNGKDDRERDRDYRAGYNAGRAKRDAIVARPEGRDYSRGYIDGYNRYRERIAVDSKNRAYAAGYRAGQSDHTALVARQPALGRPTPIAPASSADNLVGRPASVLDSDMKALGFERVAQFKKGKESFTTWQSREQNRCLRIMTREGKVQQTTHVDIDRCM